MAITVNPSVVPGLLLLLAEFVALAGVGYAIVRVALRETDHRVALAQGLVVGPAIWGVVVNLAMYALPGIPGGIAGWIFVLALAAVLVWRSPNPLRPRLRTAAVFGLTALALFWAALASRQLLTVIDDTLHLGLAASIRAGAFPPEMPWNPGTPTPYHYGFGMLNGLLAPPSGPDLAFVHELLGAYAWMSLVLVVGTAILRRGGWFSALVLTPLLLAAGAWTFPRALDLLEIPIPAGLPAAGIRASLTDIYWPSAQWPLDSYYAALPNIWKPAFPLAYVLAFVIIERAASSGRRTWPAVLTLAGLTGFLGLTSATLTPIVLLSWAVLEAVHLLKSRRPGAKQPASILRPFSGLLLAAVLLVVEGGASSVALTGSMSFGVSLEWGRGADNWSQMGSFDPRPGGVALLGLGPLAVAGIAALLARRDRLVLALVAGTVMLVILALVLRYEPAPWDTGRLAGHARNFALFALLLALGGRMSHLRPRWRYAAGAALAALIVWPTISAPFSNLRLAIGRGIEIANAGVGPQTDAGWFAGRYVLRGLPDRIAAFIRDHTTAKARVFSPHPHQMSYATGRANAWGFNGLVHVAPRVGPGYRDVLDYLEPAAVRRLGFEYVHATESWVEGLPGDAAARLDDPSLFELVVRDDSESLYRVLPAFLALDAPPAPGSYEALRQAVPASTTVFVSSISDSSPSADAAEPLLSSGAVRERRLILARAASVLTHARLLGTIDPSTLYLRTPWTAEPLGDQVPDLVIMPLDFVPWMLPASSRQPIWWNDEAAVYALDGAVAPTRPPPPGEQFPFSVRVSDVSAMTDGRLSFTATFEDRAPGRWSGQDWILVATEVPPWDLPTQLLADGRTPPAAIWFGGLAGPGSETTSLEHHFDFLKPGLSVRDEDGALVLLPSSAPISGPGAWTLAVRVRREYQPRLWRDVAIIAVLRIRVSESGEFSYQVYEDARG